VRTRRPGGDQPGGPSAGRGDRVAPRLGKQAEIDAGARPGLTTAESAEIAELQREIRELRRANEILRAAAIFFGAELDRPRVK